MASNLSPWVFPESGDFMICTKGQDGGTVPYFDKLFPAFDYEHEDGSTHWCVRHQLLGGDSVPIAEMLNGAGQDMLRGVVVDGVGMSESDGDAMDFELRGYLAGLFAMAPLMHAFIKDVANGYDGGQQDKAAELLRELYKVSNTREVR